MANNYYNFPVAFVAGTKVRSDQVNSEYSGIESAFDLLPTTPAHLITGKAWFGTDVQGATVNEYIITTPDPQSPLDNGQRVSFFATHTNDGGVTFNVDGNGLVAAVDNDGDPLAANAIINGQYYEFVYDDTNTQWLRSLASSQSIPGGVQYSVQINDPLDTFAGNANFTFDTSTNIFTVGDGSDQLQWQTDQLLLSVGGSIFGEILQGEFNLRGSDTADPSAGDPLEAFINLESDDQNRYARIGFDSDNELQFISEVWDGEIRFYGRDASGTMLDIITLKAEQAEVKFLESNNGPVSIEGDTGSLGAVNGALIIDNDATIFMAETGSAQADVAGYGQIWVNDNFSPSRLFFTNDAGIDIDLTAVGGSPGGADTEVQYNNGGAFGGMGSAMQFNDSNNRITMGATIAGSGTQLLIQPDVTTGFYVNIIDNAETLTSGTMLSVGTESNNASGNIVTIDAISANNTAIPLRVYQGATTNQTAILIESVAAGSPRVDFQQFGLGVQTRLQYLDSTDTFEIDSTNDIALYGANTEILRIDGQSALLSSDGDLVFTEKADHSSSITGGFGYLWVRDDTPTVLVFTNDAGTDTVLGAGGGGSPGGADTQIQYNDGGAFGGDANLTWNDSTERLTVGGPSGNGDNLRVIADFAEILLEDSSNINNSRISNNFDDTTAFNDRRMNFSLNGSTKISIKNDGIEFDEALFIEERAAADTDRAAYGQIWVKDDTPNTLWFTDDTGVDYQLGVASGTQLSTITYETAQDLTGQTSGGYSGLPSGIDYFRLTIEGAYFNASQNLEITLGTGATYDSHCMRVRSDLTGTVDLSLVEFNSTTEFAINLNSSGSNNRVSGVVHGTRTDGNDWILEFHGWEPASAGIQYHGRCEVNLSGGFTGIGVAGQIASAFGGGTLGLSYGSPGAGLPAEVAFHERGGNTQIHTGDDADTGIPLLNVSSVLTENTFESIGPTGSGASNIWTAMDNIPAGATHVVIDIWGLVAPSGASAATLDGYGVRGDDASPVASQNVNQIFHARNDQNGASGNVGLINRTEIPLDSSLTFQFLWQASNESAQQLLFFYRGFRTDAGLLGGAGTGNVSNSGTPVDDQIAVWVDDETIEGTVGLTYTNTPGNPTLGGTLELTGSNAQFQITNSTTTLQTMFIRNQNDSGTAAFFNKDQPNCDDAVVKITIDNVTGADRNAVGLFIDNEQGEAISVEQGGIILEESTPNHTHAIQASYGIMYCKAPVGGVSADGFNQPVWEDGNNNDIRMLGIKEDIRQTVSGSNQTFSNRHDDSTKITMIYEEVGISLLSNIRIRMGDATGGTDTSGYTCRSWATDTSGNVTTATFTDGFNIQVQSAASLITGEVVFRKSDRAADDWVVHGTFIEENGASSFKHEFWGTKSQSEFIDRVVSNVASGVHNAGNIQVHWEV